MNPPSKNEMYTGWDVNGIHVYPVSAYTNIIHWFTSFLSLFPEKEKRMRQYSKEKGWTNVVFAQYWIPAVINWLNKNHGENKNG